MSFEDRGDFVFLHARHLRMKWDNESTVYLTLNNDLRGKGVLGLCGSFDGESDDDLVANGQPEPNPVAFANQWMADENVRFFGTPRLFLSCFSFSV